MPSYQCGFATTQCIIIIMTSSCSNTTGAGAVKWCFLALLLLRQHVHVQSAKSYGGLCSPADRPVTCLFKGLLKSAMIYASRRNEIASDGNQLQQSSKGIEQYLVEQIRNLLGLFSFGFQLPVEVTAPWSLLKSSFFNGTLFSLAESEKKNILYREKTNYYNSEFSVS